MIDLIKDKRFDSFSKSFNLKRMNPSQSSSEEIEKLLEEEEYSALNLTSEYTFSKVSPGDRVSFRSLTSNIHGKGIFKGTVVINGRKNIILFTSKGYEFGHFVINKI